MQRGGVVQRDCGRVVIAPVFLARGSPWRLVVLLDHDFLLKLALDAMNFEQQDVGVDHLRLLRHRDQVWKILELDLRHRVRTQALLVLFEDQLELLQFDLQDLDVVHILVPLLLQLVHLCSQLPLILLAIFDLSDSSERPLRRRELVHGWVLHDHIIVALRPIGILILLEVLLLQLTVTVRLGSGSSPSLHIHHDPLLLESLRVGRNAAHLSDPLLPELPFSRLHLLDEDLGLEIVWLHLADVLLMRRRFLAWYVWVLLLGAVVGGL